MTMDTKPDKAAGSTPSANAGEKRPPLIPLAYRPAPPPPLFRRYLNVLWAVGGTLLMLVILLLLRAVAGR